MIGYLAHPLNPIGAETIHGNVTSALAWINWIRIHEPAINVLCPWIPPILAGADDSDAGQRARGMRENFEIIERCCDGVILVAGRISKGMRQEATHLLDLGKRLSWIADLTHLGRHPPADWTSSTGLGPVDEAIQRWYQHPHLTSAA